jgi:hypothetical protein
MLKSLQECDYEKGKLAVNVTPSLQTILIQLGGTLLRSKFFSLSLFSQNEDKLH